MPQVDFTLDDLKKVFATKDDIASLRQDFRNELNTVKTELGGEIRKVRVMLEEDFRAESKRLDRVDRRSKRTQRLLSKHSSEHLTA